MGILQVREIIEYDTVTRVPGAPAWVRGVTNLRGSVVPVIDLAVKLGLPPSTPSPAHLHRRGGGAFQGEKLVLGVLADAVGQVVELGPADVEPPPAFGAPVRMDYLVGMGRAGKKFILLLDMDRVLSGPELAAAGVAAPTRRGAAP